MFYRNNYFKSKPNFRPPSPTKTGRDIAWLAPIIGCPVRSMGYETVPIYKHAEARTAHRVRPHHEIGGLADHRLPGEV
jgi:hypothetical protein